MINRINNILASTKNEKNTSESDIQCNKKTNQEEYTKKFVNKNQYDHQSQHDIFTKYDSSSSNLDLQLSNFKYFKKTHALNMHPHLLRIEIKVHFYHQLTIF